MLCCSELQRCFQCFSWLRQAGCDQATSGSSMPEATRNRCYFYNSFFYKKLSEKQPGLPAVNYHGALRGRQDRPRASPEVDQGEHCPASRPEAVALLPYPSAQPHLMMMLQHPMAAEAPASA